MMRIDPTTLADLDVFGGLKGGGGLFALVDHTRSRAGRAALHRRLERPLTDVDDIRAVQAAVEALSTLSRPLRIDDRVLQGVERYVGSRIVMTRGRRLRAWLQEGWFRVRYRDVIRELDAGRAAVRMLVHLARSVSDRIGGPDAPGLLREMAVELDRAVRELGPALEFRSLLWTDRRLRGEAKESILEAVATLGELDALHSMAVAGAAPGWSRPELVESPSFLLEAEEAVHPFLDDATPNPVRLTGGEPLVFLTGPNMAGKTTYLRTVALVVVLAQTGMNVPARNVRLTPVEAVFTSLNPADDLRAGVSYFYAEILRVKQAAELLAEGRRALVLFDEVFKGTNVKDALEASARVILGFARSRRSGSIFSSHLSELAETLSENPAIRFCRFTGEIRRGRPSFTFRLEDGVSDQRFGMLLLEEARVPELIARIDA